MPTYSFYNPETEEVLTELMTIAEMEQFEKDNPHLVMIPAAPLIHSGRGMGKVDDSFNDILKNIKKEHSKGLTGSTVNTF